MKDFFKRKKIVFAQIYFLLLLTISSCKPIYQTQTFVNNQVPESPNYETESSWAVLPWTYSEDLQKLSSQEQDTLIADVFYVYPTLLLDKKDTRWNVPITDSSQNKKVLNIAVQFQASAWATAGKLYVPYYRQAHIRAYTMYNQGGKQAFEIAYADVKAAFETYLKKYNKGRPIIIASHSQGTTHTKQLLQDFFDGKELQKQLIAAYIPGIGVYPNEFKHIKSMTSPTETGGFVSWNTYKKNKYPKNYDSWYKGKVASNPITWDMVTITDFSQHKGFYFVNGKFYEKALKIKITDGLVWTSLPRFPLRLFAIFKKNYHTGDINLFWKDIKINAEARVNAWN
ncbi:DUF3089 domain-containing protein [Olleya sp. AH-315-F22]|nr:DUF3089 domain-containing protein [Olleya sp. AH-315-F22]